MIMWNFIEVCDLISFWKWPPVGCMTASNAEHFTPLFWRKKTKQNRFDPICSVDGFNSVQKDNFNIPLKTRMLANIYNLLPFITYVRSEGNSSVENGVTMAIYLVTNISFWITGCVLLNVMVGQRQDLSWYKILRYFAFCWPWKLGSCIYIGDAW